MAIDALSVWKDELEKLPKEKDDSWADNIAKYYADRIANIEPNQSVLNTDTGFSFTFPEAVFANALKAMKPTVDPVAAMTQLSDIWAAAISTSVILVSPEAYAGEDTPAKKFSVVATALIDPPSVLLGKAKIIELATTQTVDDVQKSEFPIKLREATLLLTITVTGTNSVTPTSAPLVAPLVPLT